MAATTVNLSAISARLPQAVRQPCGQGVTHWAAAGRLAPLCRFVELRCQAAPDSATLLRNVAARLRLAQTAAQRRQPTADSSWAKVAGHGPATSGLVAKPCTPLPLCPCPSLFRELASIPAIHHQPTASVGTSCASAPGPSTKCLGCGFDSAGVGWPVWGRLIALGAAGDGTQEKTVAAMPNGPMRQPRKRMNTARESRKSGSTWSKPCTTTL